MSFEQIIKKKLTRCRNKICCRLVPAKDVSAALAARSLRDLDGGGSSVAEANLGGVVDGHILIADHTSANAVVYKFTLAGARGGRR